MFRDWFNQVLTLMITENFPIPLKMLYQIPASEKQNLLMDLLYFFFFLIEFWCYLHCNVFSLLTYIFCSYCVWPPQFSNKFLCIQTDFDDVVQKSKERCQRERGNKECDKAKLDNWKRNIQCFFISSEGSW